MVHDYSPQDEYHTIEGRAVEIFTAEQQLYKHEAEQKPTSTQANASSNFDELLEQALNKDNNSNKFSEPS